MPDLNDGARAMETLRRELLDTDRVRQEAAKAVLDRAQQLARSRPTPQARMVASGMQVKRGTVIGFAGTRVFGSGSRIPVKLGFLAFGSEFGSNTNRQFGTRRESGYWLNPAAEGTNAGIDEAHEDDLDAAIDAAIRSAGP
jgi:hypothetical protein